MPEQIAPQSEEVIDKFVNYAVNETLMRMEMFINFLDKDEKLTVGQRKALRFKLCDKMYLNMENKINNPALVA